jgi:trehalose 6-phosphate synthase
VFRFYRAADLCYVSSLHDGMNLVAKEFVAAQDPKDPGVLIISPMAGAARELTGALQVNPYDKRGMAQALQRALHMSLDERRQRHRRMLDALRANDIHHWYGTFCADLEEATSHPPAPRMTVRVGPADSTSRGWWQRTVGRFFNSKAS